MRQPLDEAMDLHEAARIFNTVTAPRHLFHVGWRKSRGGLNGNTANVIDPLCGCEHMENGHYLEGMIAMSWEKAAMMCDMHWRASDHYLSAFSSWTSSLLEALAYGLREQTGDDPEYVFDDPEDVFIYVLDTSTLRANNRVFSSRKLMQAFEIDKRPDGKDLYERAAGEYLVYGKLYNDDGFTAVRLYDLVSAGLLSSCACKLSPSLIKPYERNRVLQRIIGLRSFYSHPRHYKREADTQRDVDVKPDGTEVWPLRPQYTPTLLKLGECFGTDLAAVMSVAFANLRRRDVHFYNEKVDNFLEELNDFPFEPYIDLESERKFALAGDIEESKNMWIMLERLQELREGRPQDAESV